ncbi:CAP domain-containing protein [Micromonospora wenchangensis]|uniref:CAP domain-containing protein n=1 Tax=Micromonospora wenchangensis TaxID=1185415 RepID=UPI003827BB67
MPLFRGRRSVTPARKRPVEATGVYGWTDPNDPDAAYRRPQPSTDDPAWLTDRPAPRSAYLFGDEPAVDAPAQPGPGGADTATGGTPGPAADRWTDMPPGQHPTGPWQGEQTGWQDAPTGRWDAGPAGQWAAAEQADAWPDDRTAARQEDAWQAHRAAAPPAGRWSDDQDEPAGTWQDDRTDRWQDDRTGAWQGQPAAGQARQEPWQGRPDESWSGDGADRWAPSQGGPWHDGVDRAAGPDGPWADAPTEHDARQAYPAAGPVRSDLRDATVPTPAVGPVDGVAATGRTRRRSRRPVLIGGAAAAATLVVSLGIGAVLLPDDDGNADRAALDEPVATAPVIPDTAPSSTPASPSATPSPSPTSASPSPSRTATPTPTPSRTQAASRATARGGSGTVPPAAPTTTRAAVSGGGGGSQAQQVVDLVNAERAKAGCAAVTVDAKLTLAAQQHSQDQADHQTMTHTGSDGSDAGQRLDRAGYAWRTYGENVAWNQQTPAAVMQAWMNSSGHRANILNCAFTEIGVGVANGNGPYWTQDFAAPR